MIEVEKMTQTDINRIKRSIRDTLRVHIHVSPARTRQLLKFKNLRGKLYEAEVLSNICKDLVTKEGLYVKMIGNGNLVLKAKGSNVNRNFPYFEVYRKNGKLFGELFTDVYFNALSGIARGGLNELNGDYHELDIALLEPDVSVRPNPEQIFLAVECKNTNLKKSTIRELLGFRRELSHDITSSTTKFDFWPATTINAFPASVHMLYISRDEHIDQFIENCEYYGILLKHHPI